VADSDLTEAVPSARRADLVVRLEDASGAVRHVVVVEVQRTRNEAKLRAWPLYVAYLQARHRVEVTLLVIAFRRSVARWARLGILNRDLGGRGV
jgi:hypothetical protein